MTINEVMIMFLGNFRINFFGAQIIWSPIVNNTENINTR